MKNLHLIIIFALTSASALCQSSFKLDYNIKVNLKSEVSDGSEQFIQEWYLRLDSMKNDELTLAKGRFDSIVLVEYSMTEKEPLIIFWGNFFDTSKTEYEKERFTSSLSLARSIMNYLNNPNNYNWSECGSPIAEHELQLFEKGNLILRIVISCDYSQVHLSKKNEIIKYGALNERGINSTLYKLIKEIKTTANISNRCTTPSKR